MHSKSDNIEVIINDKADEIVKQPFDSFKNRYQNNLELMKGSDFVFNYVLLLYYKCHKISLSCSGLYINTPDWIKNKKPAINSISIKDNNCSQYAVTVKKDPQIIKKIKPL